jgi:hypothetical protein
MFIDELGEMVNLTKGNQIVLKKLSQACWAWWFQDSH